jgi:ATP synthase mitochondrial F1 complex assembly factor 2
MTMTMTTMYTIGGNVALRSVVARKRPTSCHVISPVGKSSGTYRALSSTKSTTSRDTRLAGRLRFYKQVDVTPLDASPWESISTPVIDSNSIQQQPSDQQQQQLQSTIANPISAGVDGTQSATGVHHVKSENPISKEDGTVSHRSNLEWMLTPRLPGETTSSHAPSLTNISWYGVTLDGRTLSTPMGQKLAVPSQALAYMIAAEWDAQTTRIQPTNMPLMTLACTVLDQAAYHPQVYQQEALKFLPTDTTCFWADPTEDRVLHRRQEQAWTGIHDYCHERLGAKPIIALGSMEGIWLSRQQRGNDSKQSSGLPHPNELLETARTWTESLDAWQLVALNSINSQSKSFLVGFSILDARKGKELSGGSSSSSSTPISPYFVDLNKAVEASRVEEEFQISSWGLVEGGHDYDRVNCSIQLFSANLFAKTILLDNNIW